MDIREMSTTYLKMIRVEWSVYYRELVAFLLPFWKAFKQLTDAL
jgi:hypothetical protein